MIAVKITDLQSLVRLKAGIFISVSVLYRVLLRSLLFQELHLFTNVRILPTKSYEMFGLFLFAITAITGQRFPESPQVEAQIYQHLLQSDLRNSREQGT